MIDAKVGLRCLGRLFLVILVCVLVGHLWINFGFLSGLDCALVRLVLSKDRSRSDLTMVLTGKDDTRIISEKTERK